LRDAPKLPQQFVRYSRTNPGNILKSGLNRALGSPLPVKTDGKPMSFIPNLLN
jgi:hypothetical protein